MRPSDNREDAVKLYLENVCGQHSPADYALLLIIGSRDPPQPPYRAQNRRRLAAKVIAAPACAEFVRRSTGTEVAKVIIGVGGRESEHVIAGNRPSPMSS
jgi:hypothetical protein